jgi:hypothetical protein
VDAYGERGALGQSGQLSVFRRFARLRGGLAAVALACVRTAAAPPLVSRLPSSSGGAWPVGVPAAAVGGRSKRSRPQEPTSSEQEPFSRLQCLGALERWRVAGRSYFSGGQLHEAWPPLHAEICRWRLFAYVGRVGPGRAV